MRCLRYYFCNWILRYCPWAAFSLRTKLLNSKSEAKSRAKRTSKSNKFRWCTNFWNTNFESIPIFESNVRSWRRNFVEKTSECSKEKKKRKLQLWNIWLFWHFLTFETKKANAWPPPFPMRSKCNNRPKPFAKLSSFRTRTELIWSSNHKFLRHNDNGPRANTVEISKISKNFG